MKRKLKGEGQSLNADGVLFELRSLYTINFPPNIFDEMILENAKLIVAVKHDNIRLQKDIISQ
jgi:hydroxypyruvate isomerase